MKNCTKSSNTKALKQEASALTLFCPLPLQNFIKVYEGGQVGVSKEKERAETFSQSNRSARKNLSRLEY